MTGGTCEKSPFLERCLRTSCVVCSVHPLPLWPFASLSSSLVSRPEPMRGHLPSSCSYACHALSARFVVFLSSPPPLSPSRSFVHAIPFRRTRFFSIVPCYFFAYAHVMVLATISYVFLHASLTPIRAHFRCSLLYHRICRRYRSCIMPISVCIDGLGCRA